MCIYIFLFWDSYCYPKNKVNYYDKKREIILKNKYTTEPLNTYIILYFLHLNMHKGSRKIII